MKKMCFLWLFTSLVMIASAQDIAPGQQAQGYLDDKNATVDYATGIFHYKVPLYTLGNGGFSLPVTLDYTAKGVKAEDEPGLVGYNWTLNTGGVVTRTIRGGIADEEVWSGYLYNLRQADAVSLIDDVKKVNRHERDGESDIFTAVFNGRSVHFILGLDADKRICALPLEQTNVRIECEQDLYNTIDSWTVTDEEGNRYIYRQKEWSADIVKEEAVSFNGLRGKSYVSSWYLNRIEPVNGAPVVYHYLAEAKQNGKQDGILLTQLISCYTTRYSYGRKLREHIFDFSPFRDDFNSAIEEAKEYLNQFSLELQLENSLYEFVVASYWARNPDFEKGVQAINNNFRVMGQLSDFRNISSASKELIDVLNQLDRTYSSQSSQNAIMAASCFRRAKSYVIESLLQVKEVSEREVGNGTVLTVRSPVLTRIVCGNNVLDFNYKPYGEGWRFSSLRLGTVAGLRLSGVELETSMHLNRLTFTDRDSVEVSSLNFEYYSYPSGTYYTSDLWGYYRKLGNVEDDKYQVLTDPAYIRISSLKAIRLSGGGKMEVDYEPNQSVPYLLGGSGLFTDSMPYGGLRLKSLIYHDGISDSGDTVLYRYPLPSIPVYPKITNRETLQYSGFSDRLVHTRMKFKGIAFLNTGNNGLYYRQVEEIRSRQGKKSYTFYIPSYFVPHVDESFYPFWLVGLPLSTSEYDENGQLRRMIRNHYETDFSVLVSHFDPNVNGSYFSAGDSGFGYRGEYPQLKADEYYMDAGYLEKYYRDQNNVEIFFDGIAHYCLNPYKDVYLPNIQPRTTRASSNLSYMLRYGGKTLLKSQKEYCYDRPGADGELFRLTEYFYDNPGGSVRPTRVVRTDAHGDRYTEVTGRVTEMSASADTSLARLVAANILSLPVKQAYLKNDTLLRETVTTYTVVPSGGRLGVGIKNRYRYVPQPSSVYRMNVQDPLLFTYSLANYTLEEENDYRWNRDLFLLSDSRDRMSEVALCTDPNTGETILEASAVKSSKVIAADLHPYLKSQEVLSDHSRYLYLHICYRKFYEAVLTVQKLETSELYWDYVESSGHQQLFRLLEIIVCHESYAYRELSSLCDSLKMNPNNFSLFRHQYSKLFQKWLPEKDLQFLTTSLLEISRTLTTGLILEPHFWETGGIVLDYKDTGWGLSVDSPSEINCLRLYMLGRPKNLQLTWEVHHAGGVTQESASAVDATGYSLQWFDLNLSPFQDVSRVCVSLPLSTSDNVVHYLALVPAGVPFRATSYNADGTVFCTFDQTGRLELNEYDSAGRLVRVKDQHGQLLESYEHHIVNP